MVTDVAIDNHIHVAYYIVHYYCKHRKRDTFGAKTKGIYISCIFLDGIISKQVCICICICIIMYMYMYNYVYVYVYV